MICTSQQSQCFITYSYQFVSDFDTCCNINYYIYLSKYHARLNEQLNDTTAKLSEYSDYTTKTTFKYQAFETRENEHRTICSKCSKNELKSCHSVCNCIPFGANIINCQIFGIRQVHLNLPKTGKIGYYCSVCGHRDKHHCHSKQFPVTIEKKEEKIDENRKSIFLETQNEIRRLRWDIKDIKRKEMILNSSLKRALENIINFSYELKVHCPLQLVNSNIDEYIKKSISGVSKQDYNISSNARTLITQYNRLSQIYSIRNLFCAFCAMFDKSMVDRLLYQSTLAHADTGDNVLVEFFVQLRLGKRQKDNEQLQEDDDIKIKLLTYQRCIRTLGDCFEDNNCNHEEFFIIFKVIMYLACLDNINHLPTLNKLEKFNIQDICCAALFEQGISSLLNKIVGTIVAARDKFVETNESNQLRETLLSITDTIKVELLFI